MSVLAPMVRLGTLPLRLLALERGAELVYSEEIVDAKLAKSQRVVDERLGTTDWRLGGGIVLRLAVASMASSSFSWERPMLSQLWQQWLLLESIRPIH